MADGRVVISTELDNGDIQKGVKEITGELGGLKKVASNVGSAIKIAFSDVSAGSKEMETAVREAANAVEGIGDSAKTALQKQVDAFAKQNSLYAQQRQKVDELRKKLSELYGKQVETEAFKSASAEADRLEQKMNALIDKQERFVATGGNTDSRTFQQMEYDLEQVIQKLNAAEAEKQRLLDSGKAYRAADTSAIDQQLTAECEKLRLMHSSLVTSFDALNAKLAEYGAKAETGTEKTGQFSGALTGLNNGAASAAKEMATVSSSAGSVGRNLGGGIKTLLKYGLSIRSLYLLFNKIRSAITDGFNNLVQFDSEANDSVSALSGSLAQLKNSLATAFSPILTAVAPALTTMINLLAQAANYVAMFMAALGGRSTYTKAVAVQEDYAASLKSTGSAAKAASKSLAGFDEITKLSSNDSSGGGGGASASASDMFETDAIAPGLQAVADVVREVMGAFEGLYNLITGKITLSDFVESLTPLQSALLSVAACITAITVALAGMKAANAFAAFIVGVKSLEAAGIIGKIAELIAVFSGAAGPVTSLADAMSMVFGTVATVIAGIGAIVGGAVLAITNFFSMLANGFHWLNEVLMVLGVALAAVGAVILGAPALVAAVVAAIVAAVATAVVVIKDNWDAIVAWFSKVCTSIGQFFTDLWQGISEAASVCWAAIVKFFTPAVEWFSKLFGSIRQTVSDVFYNIGVIASGCWEIVKAVWGAVSGWFNATVIQPVSKFFANLWDGFLSKAKAAWEGVKTVFGTVAGFFKDIFSDAWAGIVKVFSVAGEIFVDIKDGILTAFKAVVNGIIRGLNSAISIPFSGINTALRAIKNINILGLTPFSGLRTISVPQIPYLAQGAVLPANKPFLAMVGDQRNGTNVEAPLATIQEAVANVMDDQLAAMMAGFEAVVQAIREQDSSIVIGDDVIYRAYRRYQTKMAVVTGGSL